MSKSNKFVKAIGYVVVYLLTAVQGYSVGLLITSTLMTLMCTIWSFFCPLPPYVTQHYGKVFLLSGIVPGIIVYVYTVVKVNRASKKGASAPSD